MNVVRFCRTCKDHLFGKEGEDGVPLDSEEERVVAMESSVEKEGRSVGPALEVMQVASSLSEVVEEKVLEERGVVVSVVSLLFKNIFLALAIYSKNN